MSKMIKSTNTSTSIKTLFANSNSTYSILVEHLEWDGSVADFSKTIFSSLEEADFFFSKVD